MATDLTVSKTILEQLGGRRFIAMTGAKNFTGTDNSLTFRLPGKNFTKNSINCVRIELSPNDTYIVTFSRLRGVDLKVISMFRDVYVENLHGIFTEVTGLDTHL